MGSQESVRFGEENDLETEDVLDRAAHSSVDLDNTHDEEETYHDANPGVVDGVQGGFGSASLGECLGRLVQPTTTSATCHSGGGRFERHHISPDQPTASENEALAVEISLANCLCISFVAGGTVLCILRDRCFWFHLFRTRGKQ